jgi:hypothetical protein
MGLNEFVIRVLDDVHSELQLTLDGMDLEQLNWRPTPQSNSMAWIAWHIARLQDARAAALSGDEQLWVKDGWHARFGLPADPDNHGRGHSDDDVDSVRPESAECLSEYASAAHTYLRSNIEKLPDTEASTPVTGSSGDSSVSALVFRAVHGGLAHVGQMMYIRGLVEKRHWFPR